MSELPGRRRVFFGQLEFFFQRLYEKEREKKHTLHCTEGDDEILYTGVHGGKGRVMTERGISSGDTSAMFAVVYNH